MSEWLPDDLRLPTSDEVREALRNVGEYFAWMDACGFVCDEWSLDPDGHGWTGEKGDMYVEVTVTNDVWCVDVQIWPGSMARAELRNDQVSAAMTAIVEALRALEVRLGTQ